MKKGIKIVFILMALMIACTLFACNHSLYSINDSSLGLSLTSDETVEHTIYIYERENDSTTLYDSYTYEYDPDDTNITVYGVMLHLGYSVEGYSYHYYKYDESVDTKLGDLIDTLNVPFVEDVSIVRVKGDKHSYKIEYHDENDNKLSETESFDVESIPVLRSDYAIEDSESYFRINSEKPWSIFDYTQMEFVPISSLEKKHLGDDEVIILKANAEKYKFTITYYDENNGLLDTKIYSLEDGTVPLDLVYNPVQANYRFVSWTYNGEEVSSIDSSLGRDYYIKAKVKQYLFKIQYYSRTGSLLNDLTRDINIDNVVDSVSVNNADVLAYVDGELTQLAENTSLDKDYYAAHWTTKVGDFSTRVTSISKEDIKADIDLYLLIEKDLFDIRFYDRKGELIESLNTTYRKSTDSIRDFSVSEKCTEEGYVFAGWLNEEGEAVTKIDPLLSRDLSFHANMNRIYLYKIVNKANTSDIIYGNGTIETILDAMNAHFSTDITGYEKRLYYGENPVIVDGNIDKSLINATIATTQISEEIEFEFTYRERLYTVTYYLNGGEWGDNHGLPGYTINTSTYAIPKPTRYGYIFLGWTYEGQESPQLNVSIVTGSTGEKEYYANWQGVEVTVSNNVNTQTIKVRFGEKYENLFDDPQIPGYHFKGWKLENATDGDYITKETVCNIAENHKLLPDISAIEYTLTYYYYDGKQNEEEKVQYNTDFTLKGSIEREGYTFDGWMYNGELLSTEKTQWQYTQDITVVAKWTPNVYKVTIKGCKDDIVIDATYDAKLNLAEALPEDGEVVFGFYTEENGEGDVKAARNGIIEKYTIAGDSTYYAFYAIYGNTFLDSININGKALKDAGYSLAIDGEVFVTKKDYKKIGYHSVSIVNADNIEIVSKKIFIKEDLKIDNGKHYYEPPVLNHADADVYIDGKLIEDFYSYKITTNGQHTIKVVGTGGYEVEYVVYFDNPHYTLFWYVLGGAAFLLCCAIIFVLIGRKNVIYYDYDRK